MLGFEDGTEQLQIPFGVSNRSSASYQKRSTGEGVKKEFQTSIYEFVEKLEIVVLYFRTTVEIEGFGTNYNPCNSCNPSFPAL